MSINRRAFIKSMAANSAVAAAATLFPGISFGGWQKTEQPANSIQWKKAPSRFCDSFHLLFRAEHLIQRQPPDTVGNQLNGQPHFRRCRSTPPVCAIANRPHLQQAPALPGAASFLALKYGFRISSPTYQLLHRGVLELLAVNEF